MRLMYLHLWCLGLRINEVCSIKREGYYLKEGVAWLRIYQHKMKMEKVIPIPMLLYTIGMKWRTGAMNGESDAEIMCSKRMITGIA